jgi:hypothetical protein
MKIELVAAEPLIVDPVAIAFDRRGRMFVAEYRDYPTGPSQQDGVRIGAGEFGQLQSARNQHIFEHASRL